MYFIARGYVIETQYMKEHPPFSKFMTQEFYLM